MTKKYRRLKRWKRVDNRLKDDFGFITFVGAITLICFVIGCVLAGIVCNLFFL